MQYVTEDQLAAALAVSRITLWQLRKEGLPHVRVRGCLRYRPDEVEAWLRKCTQHELLYKADGRNELGAQVSLAE